VIYKEKRFVRFMVLEAGNFSASGESLMLRQLMAESRWASRCLEMKENPRGSLVFTATRHGSSHESRSLMKSNTS
jgi:hypothetical protein